MILVIWFFILVCYYVIMDFILKGILIIDLEMFWVVVVIGFLDRRVGYIFNFWLCFIEIGWGDNNVWLLIVFGCRINWWYGVVLMYFLVYFDFWEYFGYVLIMCVRCVILCCSIISKCCVLFFVNVFDVILNNGEVFCFWRSYWIWWGKVGFVGFCRWFVEFCIF